jgi:hypothetical protein
MEKIQQQQNAIWEDLGLDLGTPEGEGFVDFDFYEPPRQQPELVMVNDDEL